MPYVALLVLFGAALVLPAAWLLWRASTRLRESD